jgi:glycosyltransferase involved in cell wall biosynthesis
VLGFVGRLTRDKGVCELVRCVQILQREGRAVHLLLLGDFESGDSVDRGTMEWICTNPAAHWLGFVPNPKPYYRLMSAFVFPTYREGLGKVLLEAAAAGIPVVSTTATGVVDVVQDGLTGILVPPGDAPALARAVTRLLDEPETAARMARAAQGMIREHFDNSFYLARLGEMIESMTAADRTPARRPPIQEARRL